jgi:neogenin
LQNLDRNVRKVRGRDESDFFVAKYRLLLQSVIIRWEPPPKEFENGIVTGYKIKYRKASSRRSQSTTTDGNRRLYVLTELARGTKYHIKIMAINVNGSGPATDWKAATTFSTDRDGKLGRAVI